MVMSQRCPIPTGRGRSCRRPLQVDGENGTYYARCARHTMRLMVTDGEVHAWYGAAAGLADDSPNQDIIDLVDESTSRCVKVGTQPEYLPLA